MRHITRINIAAAFLLPLVYLSALTLAQNRPAGAKVRDTIIELEKKSWEAWKARDGKFFESFLSDDHADVGPGGLANKKTVAGFVGSPVCVVKSYKLRDFAFTAVDASTSLLNYHAEQDTVCNGKAVPSPVWISSLYVKREEKWLNILYQQTVADK